MAKFYDDITEKQQAFIEKQHMFFVATAPMAQEGHINLSPKGMDSFRVLCPTQVAYLDLTGSGNETSAHLFENGRITVMFCAFDGPPNIVRLYGKGRAVTQNDAEWADLAKHFSVPAGVRQIMVIDVHKTQDSCGMSVPKYDFVEHRDALVKHWEKNGHDFVREYWAKRNTTSQDGLAAYPLDD